MNRKFFVYMFIMFFMINILSSKVCAADLDLVYGSALPTCLNGNSELYLPVADEKYKYFIIFLSAGEGVEQQFYGCVENGWYTQALSYVDIVMFQEKPTLSLLDKGYGDTLYLTTLSGLSIGYGDCPNGKWTKDTALDNYFVYSNMETILWSNFFLSDDAGNVINTPSDMPMDIGFSNYNDVVTSENSQYNGNVPYIKSFNVKKDGVGAMSNHVFNWSSSSTEFTNMNVEIAISYKTPTNNSSFWNKKYNEGFFTFMNYDDNIKSDSEYAKFRLSSSDGEDNVILTRVLRAVQEKYGIKEAIHLTNTTENLIKAYYIRNVVKGEDGTFLYSKWVRCEVGKYYNIGKGAVVSESGKEYEEEK